ncbi:chitinase [Actinoplanes bogorensis]|uniref:Chitinase n=1 Tax=Paractinoplanes bogorensis TaxID=1610840 RepID=A0ABS5YXH8_9ACTN|nr:glycosyl hydrolase family 18 protein [Actinoplanes bogorensis]MBU2667414.1 chitinase [Actinoplanes bogorensis]
MSDRATPVAVRPDYDPLADPDWQEPEQPRSRLSWSRLTALVLVLGLIGAGGFYGFRYLRDTAGPTAKSWAVPYVDVTLTPTFQFQDPTANPANDVALGFVVADPKSACRPSWGGAYTLDGAGKQLELDRRIDQLRKAGGDITLSLGGLNNSELAVACTNQQQLTDAYRQLITRYDVKTLDLDIEGTAVADRASLERRVTAVATVQKERVKAGKKLTVWLTLPVSPAGLTDDGVGVVRGMLEGGVDLRGVNVMTMDYNNGDARPDMLALSLSALSGTHKQLTDLYLRLGTKLTSPQVWSRIGATPMIGQNDIDTERFTLDDAEGLARFAVDNGLGRVSMWSLNRDAQCRGTFANVVVHSNTCSGVDQEALAFSKVFAGLPGKAPGSDDRDSVEIPNRAATDDDPDTSPYPVWRMSAMYVAGYKVVWHGVVYEAKWANSGVDPSAAPAAGTQTAWSVIGPVSPVEKAPRPVPVITGVSKVWQPGRTYQRGTRVLYEGLPYEAKWNTTDEAPSTEFPIDADDPWKPLFTIPGEPKTN